ncbi:hypothetical protein [Cellulomonas phragmiteti]|uniref:Uncharacterized protein n=1 Tax=Cellulomonas phragmiteti TaxID=478780 RepID=A0ABQ4DN20_9CELL|nr:hypothetical protein [Cellulomonas phragmiteti]GIG40755.1 hypothetical protein Cph01nite_25170 [Cellulomonas phragmiteti]
MTEPTTPDVPPTDDAPDPVAATAPIAPESDPAEVDQILDAPEAAPGFPPALGGVPGVGQPAVRPI